MIIGVMGESGSGKTTSMRTLDPKTTIYVDCDKKGLSWKDWRTQYVIGTNYLITDDPEEVNKIIRAANDAPNIKTVVIDTLNGIMVADEMRRMKEKGYDKWVDLATSVYGLVDLALTVRTDLNIIFVCHTQTEREDNGYFFTRIKTSGKKIDKIVLESKFPVVLLAKVVDGKHIFETKANFSSAKTPLGAFEESTIDNDMQAVLDALKGF